MKKGIIKFAVCNIIIAVILSGVLSGCFFGNKIDRKIKSMSLREKVGQLFVVCPEALDPDLSGEAYSKGVKELSGSMTRFIYAYPVGGVIMFAKNISSPEQITEFNKDLQSISRIPMFISVDEEGGKVARLANKSSFGLPKYESAAAVGASGNTDDALEMGRTIGAYLKKYGFNMDFAPVADVNTNPDNPVIGKRAFSSDAAVAASMARAMADGLVSEGIIPVFKHFPGHGDTAEDSHKGIAVINKTQSRLEACEWLPFMKAGDTDCIMVGHIAVPEITGDMTPSTLSHKMVTGILRNLLGFKGLIITDALEMKAITNDYSSGEAAVAAIKAGCDVLLMPANLTKAFNAVLEAVKEGEISEERIDESVRRILTYKLTEK